MNLIRHVRRLAGILAGLGGALLAFAGAAPVAMARPLPPAGGSHYPPPLPPAHTVAPVYKIPVQTAAAAAGGMPGWAIILIAVGAALLAAVAAVLADRAWASRRRAVTPAT
jgi:hypothetical protein